jgi:putative tricarboxylic transport membrane protein
MFELGNSARSGLSLRSAATTLALAAVCTAGPAMAWEPTKPVEFVVPAGTGGGADQMARLIQGIVVKHKLMK